MEFTVVFLQIKTQYNVSDDDDDEVMWSRRCFEGQLVRSLLMISYRFSSSDKWTINTTLVSSTIVILCV